LRIGTWYAVGLILIFISQPTHLTVYDLCWLDGGYGG